MEFVRQVSHADLTLGLGYVASAVSQQVSTLERQSRRCRCFTRSSGRRLVITTAGRSLLEQVDELLAASAAFQDFANSLSRGEEIEELRVGAYETAVSHLLPSHSWSLWDPREVDDPHHRSRTRDGLPMLERGELDLLVAARYLHEDPPYHSDKLAFLELGRERLLLTASGAGEPPDFARCTALDWVAGAPEDVDRKLLHHWAGSSGFDPRVRFETRSCHTAIELIASGLAVGLIPASVIDAFRDPLNLAIVELPTPTPTREVLALTRGHFNMPLVSELLERISDAPYFI